MKLLIENWRKHLKEYEIDGADAGAADVEKAPAEIERNEYLANKERGDWTDVNALQAALEGTEFADKQIANPGEGHEVVSFTESSDGNQVLPLKQVDDTIYFKLNNVYGGSYYKIEGVAPTAEASPTDPDADPDDFTPSDWPSM